MSTTNYLRDRAQDRTGQNRQQPVRGSDQEAGASEGPGSGERGRVVSTPPLVGPHRPGPSTTPPPPGWARLAARLVAGSLDRQLAEGRPPDSSRLVTARARHFVSPAARGVLADNWDNLLVRARRAPGLRDPRVRFNRDWIVACEPDIRQMIRALRGTGPVEARGVAMASGLLSDGTGPLFNRRRSAELGTALRTVLAHLR